MKNKFIKNSKLKILWLTPYPVNLYYEFKKITNSSITHPCSWIIGLENLYKNEKSIDLNIVTLSYNIPESSSFKINNITYHYIKRTISFLKNQLTGYKKEKKKIEGIINKINPDIIHVFGTEDVFSFATLGFKHKTIIHIQGIITIYNKARGLIFDKKWLCWQLQSRWEKKSIIGHKNFFVRTEWDSSYIKELNPKANLFFCWEVLRNEFYQKLSLKNEKKYIIYLGGTNKFKGYHYVIKVFKEIHLRYPNINLVIGGFTKISQEKNKLEKKYSKKMVKKIIFSGFLNPNEIIDYFSQSIALLIFSKMENSPNSVSEAQICGVPVIAMNVGGISDLIENKKNGFLLKYGDYKSAISIIESLILNDSLYFNISNNSVLDAEKRHNRKNIKNNVINTYKKILKLT